MNALNQHSTEALKEWAQQLQTQALSQALSELTVFVVALNSPNADKVDVFNTIEVLRPFIHALNPLTKKEEPDEADARVYIALLELEAEVYEHILEKPGDLPEDVLVTTIHRSLTNKIEDQITHYRYYFFIPERKWLGIHRLFYVAVKYKVGSFGVNDDIYFKDQETSIVNLYCYLLLLSCARLSHFESRDIVKVSRLLKRWCDLVQISKTPSTTSQNQIMVDIATGSAPHFTKMFSPSELTVPCYLQIDELMQMLVGLWMEQAEVEEARQKEIELNQQKEQPVKESVDSKDVMAARAPETVVLIAEKTEDNELSADVLEYLKAAWSGYLYQEPLTKTHQAVEVCIGFKDVHFYLAGAKTLREFLGEKAFLAIIYDETDDKEMIERGRMTDLWATFLSEPKGDLAFKKTPAEFNFQHHFKEVNEAQYKNEHPIWPAMMTEVGAHDCSLIWQTHEALHLDLGQLVALRSHHYNHWQIGEIDSKIQLNDKKTKTGIKILSTQAIPVGIDLPFGLEENYCEAILTPPENMLGSVTSFISAPRDYKVGDYVSLAQRDIEEKLQINKLLKKNSHFERCACVFLIRKKSSTYRDEPLENVSNPKPKQKIEPVIEQQSPPKPMHR